MSKESWILRPYGKPKPNAELRMFCFPYAGGAASTYMDWVQWLPENIEILAVQPPGRATRIFEPAHKKMDQLIDDLLANISGLFNQPYLLFGHSLGSRVAFELMVRCKKIGLRLPSHFIASGSRGPHLPPRKAAIYHLPDKEFVEELKDINGTPREILENKELMELCLPLLRADFQIADTYTFTQQNVFDCPISVFGGETDPDVSNTDLRSWGDFFSYPVDLKMFPEGHFFIESNKQLVAKEVERIAQKVLAHLKTKSLAV